MSKILDENWEYLSRQHELFMQDPGYLNWLKQQDQSLIQTQEPTQCHSIPKEVPGHLP